MRLRQTGPQPRQGRPGQHEIAELVVADNENFWRGIHGILRLKIGGEGGIRTHEELAPLPVFKTGTFHHSVTSPNAAAHYITVTSPI